MRKVRLDLIGAPVDVDDRPFHAVGGEAVEAVIDQGSTGNLHQRLRHLFGDRTHALPQTRGEHHGRLRNRRAHRRIVPVSGRQESGLSSGRPNARGKCF